MKKIVIYTTNTCPYCLRAKSLLERKGLSYEEINIENNNELRVSMIEKSGGRKTVPQIFIEEVHVGGCDDLYALEAKGELSKLLV